MARRRSLLMLVGVLAALGAVAWWALGRGPVPAPPKLEAALQASLDEEVATRITETLGQVDASPRDAALRAELGMVYEANGLAHLAAQAYEQAVAMRPRHARWWHDLARARERLGELDAALEAIDRAIALDESVAPLHWRKGYWLLELGRLEEAERAFARSVEIDPADQAGRLGQARIALQQGEFQRASDLLDAVLRADAGNAHARSLRAAAHRGLGQTVDPRDLAMVPPPGGGDHVKPSHPWDAEMHSRQVGYAATIKQAHFLIERGRGAEAVRLLQARRRARPSDITLLNTLALAHLALNEVDEAIDVLRAALSHQPQDFAAYLNLSSAFERKQNLDLALHHAERAVEFNPTLGAAHLQRGRVLAMRSEYPPAAAALEQAVRLGVSDIPTRTMLGQIQCMLQRWEDAARTLAAVVEQEPDAAGALGFLALALGELGHHSEARAALQRAHQLAPNDPNIQHFAARLRELESRR